MFRTPVYDDEMKEPRRLNREQGFPDIMEEESGSTQPPMVLENHPFVGGGRRSPLRRSSLLLPGRSLDDDALAWFRLQVNAGGADDGDGAGGRSRRRRSSQSIDVPEHVTAGSSGGAAGGDNYQEDNEDDDDDDDNNITHSDHEGQAESSTARRRSSLRLASLMLDGAGGGNHPNIHTPSNSASKKGAPRRRRKQSRIFDDPAVTEGYNQVPLLETIRLPRGGTSISTSVGRIQFGIPPETIKDSMRLGLEIPRVFIVPVERFCREVGPALGINLAECEFPAYFNWFVKRKRCTLVVDSAESERDIRNVFEETLLGPREFRDVSHPKAYDDEDFDPSFPPSSRPNFFREFRYFRQNECTETSDELTVDVLLDFLHFSRNDDLTSPPSRLSSADDQGRNENIGVPPMVAVSDDDDDEEEHIGWHASTTVLDFDMQGLKSLGQTRVSRLMRSITEPSRSIQRTPSSRKERLASVETDGSEIAETEDGCESVSIVVVDDEEEARPWIFSQVKWLGEVATVWPADATPEQVEARAVPRVEIFKMPGASEYVIHDVDVNNYIVGKARLGGAVEVPDEMAVEGFLDSNEASEVSPPKDGLSLTRNNESLTVSRRALPFYPPSFGVTSLGNSHGFDKNGSTSGYVIWINGRGVMVDPPPYSSATLEREGIRPQTIIAIIITHCHADHDAGAFQKVLTGSRVAIITTPSIYKSFIRKYSALSGLSPGLLRRSHRFRAAVIGRPLHFQGAAFHFWYTLHTIPCIALKVESRGKSVVFTGDHLNLPPLLEELEVSVRTAVRSLFLPASGSVDLTFILITYQGVLSKGRADNLRELPLLDCDVLLHEAGAPPIHTPLKVLQELPQEVRDRLYVVHTSALPPDCGLCVAPVGTSGTIRLDVQGHAEAGLERSAVTGEAPSAKSSSSSALDDGSSMSLTVHGAFVAPTQAQLQAAGLYDASVPPLVYQRPTCVSDAWFILNLLSNIPFFSSLSYMNTMEVLEIAKIRVFHAGDVVLPTSTRKDVLCVLWEGTCMDRSCERGPSGLDGAHRDARPSGVWYAGDWLGPVALQPNESNDAQDDVIAVSTEGVKAIFLPLAELEKILRRGSTLYRKYLTVVQRESFDDSFSQSDDSGSQVPKRSPFPAFDQVVDVLRCNSVLGKLPAIQKRALEAIAEGPRVFQAGEPLWSIGDRCNYAFLIVAGTAKYGAVAKATATAMARSLRTRGSIGTFVDIGDGTVIEADKQLQHVPSGSEYAKLESVLLRRAEGWANASKSRDSSLLKADAAKTANDRFANKVLARLYARRMFTVGLVFGRGSFLSDVTRMVSGQLVLETGETASLNYELHLHS